MQHTISSRLNSFSKEVAAVAISDDVLLGVKGLLVGSAFSLMKAYELGFSGNVDSRYPHELDRIAQQIATAKLAEKGSWLAGFFFNSALLRLAAAYHILLKRMFDNTDESRKILSERAVKTGKVQSADIDLLNKVYQDTNDFKHEGGKLLRYRRIQSIDDAITAGHNLISLLGLV